MRKAVGSCRYETKEEPLLLNQLSAVLRLYTNFFQTVTKLIFKERIKSEHSDIFHASSRKVRSYVAQKKKAFYSTQEEGYLPWSHPHGKAQADFGEAVAYEKGKRIKFYSLNLSFPYSNASFTQLFKGQNQECFFAGLVTSFEYIG